MSLVKAHLAGEDFDLDTLAEIFQEGDPKVTRDSEGYWLESADLDPYIDDGARLQQEATALLNLINGTARVLKSSAHHPVTLSGTFESHGPDGSRRDAVVVASAAELRGRVKITADGVVTNSAGEVTPPGSPTPQIMLLAKSNDDVHEVLDLLAVSDLDWVGLYKIFEVIRAAAGGKALVSDPGLSDFTGSANLQGASGSKARHARPTGTAPRNVLSLAEGEAFIRRLVNRWVDSLSGHV